MGFWRSRRRQKILVCMAIFASIYLFSGLTVGPRYTFLNTDIKSDCIIPDLDPWDKSILKFNWSPDPLVCDSSQDVIFIDKVGKLRLNKSEAKRKDLKKLHCRYSEVVREDDDYVTLPKEETFTRPVYINSDFLRVKCYDIARDFHLDKILLQAYSENKKDHIRSESKDQYSVFMFGVDAVSRLASIRKLPLTYRYLKEELSAVEFKGHMKTGDNTFPNLVTMLTGKQPFTSELPPVSGPFDEYPFIWKNFSDKSYVTYFSEDSPEMHTFNLGKKGFNKQPTHHYMRPFWKAIKKTDLVSTLLDDAFIGLEANKINVRKKSSLCYGNTPKHVLTIQYYKDFVQKYSKKRRFAISWINELSHDYVNFLELGDKDFKDFLIWMKNGGHLENSFLIFLSDHGSRIDAIRNTFVGRIEERMPLLMIVPPRSFKTLHPFAYKNLLDNAQRLTSHYDIYKTLEAILNSQFQSNIVSNERGISLFNRIPQRRNCLDAGIPEHFCSCYISKPIAIDRPESDVQRMGRFIINEINKLLEPDNDKCAFMRLQQIKDAQGISLGLKHTGDVEFFSIWKYFKKPEEEETRYLILVQASPGDGLIEATVKFDKDGKFNLLDVPSRTNKYGNQSSCISDHIRKTFCYCI